MTDTQADLTERARAAAERYGVSTLKDRLIAEIISIAQSERKAAAAEARRALQEIESESIDFRAVAIARKALAALASPPAPQEETRAK